MSIKKIFGALKEANFINFKSINLCYVSNINFKFNKYFEGKKSQKKIIYSIWEALGKSVVLLAHFAYPGLWS